MPVHLGTAFTLLHASFVAEEQSTSFTSGMMMNHRNWDDASAIVSQQNRKSCLRTTKIVCTLGPSSSSEGKLKQLLDAGMGVARFNMSHGTHVSHAITLRNLRRALAHRPLSTCSALLDTKGPEIRSGLLHNHRPVALRRHQHLRIVADYTYVGSAASRSVSCSYPHLALAVQRGQRILIADGNIQLTVLECHGSSVLCRVETNCVLSEHKNMFVPGANVDLPTLTEKDRRDIQFAVDEGFDILSGSLVRTSHDVREIRRMLGRRGSLIRVHAKVESSRAVKNLMSVMDAADGVHVSRGDLGMEMNLEKVFLAQKLVVGEANMAGKPVVVATQVLHSMLSRPQPSSAECSDIANVVIDGADCVMLSGETARGMFPIRAVCIMDRVCCEAERCLRYGPRRCQSLLSCAPMAMGACEAIASSAVELSVNVGAQLIIVVDDAGMVGQLVSKYRPEVPVLVFTGRPTVARQLTGICRGLYSFLARTPCAPLQCTMPIALSECWLGPCDTMVLVNAYLHSMFHHNGCSHVTPNAAHYKCNSARASVHQVALRGGAAWGGRTKSEYVGMPEEGMRPPSTTLEVPTSQRRRGNIIC